MLAIYCPGPHGTEQDVAACAGLPGERSANGRLLRQRGRGSSLGPTFSRIGAVRVVLEPKPGPPTDPNNPRAFIDIFTDISPLFVINNESGWYEGWMIHDLVVPPIAPPRPDGHAQFATITERDAEMLKKMGTGNNVPAHIFTADGRAPHFPGASDRFPNRQTNIVPLHVSMGTYNAMQQADAHSYWEFNYLGTNWVHPPYELPFTGGFPDQFGQAPDTFRDGEIGKLQSIVPGSGPAGIQNDPKVFGDNPSLPRAALFTALSGLESQSGPLSDLFLGRTDNIDIRFAAAIALLFNVLMVVVAIIAIALTVPRDDPGVGR